MVPYCDGLRIRSCPPSSRARTTPVRDCAYQHGIRVEAAKCPDAGLQRCCLVCCRVDGHPGKVAPPEEIAQRGIQLGVVAARNDAGGGQQPLNVLECSPQIKGRPQKGGLMLTVTAKILRIAPEVRWGQKI